MTRNQIFKYRKMAYEMICRNANAWLENGGASEENLKNIFKIDFSDREALDFENCMQCIIEKLQARANK